MNGKAPCCPKKEIRNDKLREEGGKPGEVEAAAEHCVKVRGAKRLTSSGRCWKAVSAVASTRRGQNDGTSRSRLRKVLLTVSPMASHHSLMWGMYTTLGRQRRASRNTCREAGDWAQLWAGGRIPWGMSDGLRQAGGALISPADRTCVQHSSGLLTLTEYMVDRSSRCTENRSRWCRTAGARCVVCPEPLSPARSRRGRHESGC